MNNDLELFSEERLINMEHALSIGSLDDRPTMDEMLKITRIALAAKQAKPACFIGKQMLTDLAEENRSCGRVWLASRDEVDGNDRIPLYTTPQIAHTEQDGWKLVPIEPTDAMQVAAANAIRFDTTAINKLWTGKRVFDAMLAAAPKPEIK